MPINVPDHLPAINKLKKEYVFLMRESKAIHQDIRPLRIALLNIMPLKINTETQFLRLLSNTPLQIELDLIYPVSHISSSKNTPPEHMATFYKTFDKIKNNKYDGLIITGAPVEHLQFEEVDYWEEMKEIMEWASYNVTSTLFICWAAQAGLYYHYGIQKYPIPEKMFGIFGHTVKTRKYPITRGFDDLFFAPHSRHTEVRKEDISQVHNLVIVSESEESGIYMVIDKTNCNIFVTGHAEYDADTLKEEYLRDKKKGLKIAIPKNYFPEDNPSNPPLVIWQGHANLLLSNWLNYYVYQETPFNLNDIHR